MTKPMTRLGWTSLMLALASQASGFQSVRELQVSVPANTLRSSRTEVNGNDIFSQLLARPSVVSTRLQYRASSDESSSTTISPFKWLFPKSEQNEDNEQQSVDEYLEFLDRRYRRLHSAEKQEEPKPFSALNWLKQGSESRNDLIVTQHQQEDALYVLGVAGLASHKLLQKHHLPVDEEVSTSTKQAQYGVIDALDADIVQEGTAALLIKKFIVPLVRFLYVAQRRKEMLVASLLQTLKMFSGSALRTMIKSVVFGPVTAAKTLLEVGGGKKTLAFTAAIAGTTMLVLRPFLQAVLTEGA